VTKSVGIIDLGSNSARLLVARISDAGSYQIVCETKAVLRLASGLEPNGAIGEHGLKRTLDTLTDFARIARAHQVTEYTAVATAAVRQAKNGAEFIRTITDTIGIPIRIISEQEESLLAYTGAMNTLSETDGLLIDLGGASMELVRFSNRVITAMASLPYGAVNLTERFLPGGGGSSEAYQTMSTYVTGVLGSVPWLHTAKGLPLIGVGGTVRNLARIDRKARHYPLDVLHNYRMPPAAVEDVATLIRRTPVADRGKIPGLSTDRADIVAGGASLIWQVLARSASSELVVSGAGVREGLLFGRLLGQESSSVIPNVLDFSLRQMLQSHRLDVPRSLETSRLAMILFHGLASVHGLNGSAQRCLTAASTLSNLGASINPYGQDQNTFYMITHGRLYGLTHRELIITGAAAGFRSHGKAKSLLDPYSDLLTKSDEDVVRRLGVIVGLAREFSRYEVGAIPNLHLTINAGAVTISTESNQIPAAQVTALMALETDFRKAFGHNLIIASEPHKGGRLG